MLRMSVPPFALSGVLLLCGIAGAQTAPGQAEQFDSSAACPGAATVRIYEEQKAISANLNAQQRAMHEQNLEKWWTNRLSLCQLQQLDAHLQPLAPVLQGTAQYTSLMRDAAEEMLRAAGQISKAMTDAMDVTRHNDVGIGVALGGYLGALGQVRALIQLAATQYEAAAGLRAATQQQALAEIANMAKAQSGKLGEEAAQIARDVATEIGAPPLTPRQTPATLPASALPEAEGYLTGIQSVQAVYLPAQGALPTCGVLACTRLANLLGRNVSTFEAFSRLRPRLIGAVESPDGQRAVTMAGGMTAGEIAQGLNTLGVPAQVESGLTNMMNQLRVGRPVIAGVRSAASADAPLHAVVVEGLETQGGVAGLRIYDPVGFSYWQPMSQWQKFFTGVWVRGL